MSTHPVRQIVRVPLLLLVLAVTAFGQASPQDAAPRSGVQQLPEETALRTVIYTARKLQGHPNEAATQMAMAVAYFRRGAPGDASRVLEHSARAIDLDPLQAERGRLALEQQPPGEYAGELTPEMREADLVAAATLPPETTVGKLWEKHIRAKLAQRFSKATFQEPTVRYRENLAQVKKLFTVANDPAGYGDTGARMNQLSGLTAQADPFARTFNTRLVENVRRRVLRLEDEARRSHSLGVQDSSNDPPMVLLVKSYAFLKYVDGDVTGAFARLTETAAAGETVQERQTESTLPGTQELRAPDRTLDRRGRSLEDIATASRETKGPPSPPARRQDPPLDLAPPSPASGPSASRPAETVTSAPVVPIVNQESQDARITRLSLQALEAIRDREVPAGVVNRRMCELGAIGMGDPLVLDLDGDGRPGLAAGRASPVWFDLEGTGRSRRLDWVTPHADGLLGVDLDGDGLIGSGRELVGAAPARGDVLGALSLYDIDGDSRLSGAELADLVLWRDDGDGRCDRSEVFRLSDLGITAVVIEQEPRTRFVRSGREYSIWEWFPADR